MDRSSPRLFLCAGLQCSGSTLVSWCFLQRRDMDGVLDAESDFLLRIAPRLGTLSVAAGSDRRRNQLRIAPDLDGPLAWYKNNISSFRLSEFISHYEDEGWAVSPLLIIRDVRDTWASLLTKSYGVNGFTAEDPPLRMRFRRFKEDWELSQARGWPILRYESLLEDHEKTLRDACRQLALPWDDSMLQWTKRASQIADARNGNDSFWQTQGQNLAETLARYSILKKKGPIIGGGDLAWLEDEFRTFNEQNDYPIRAADRADPQDESTLPICNYQELRRYRWQLQRKPIRWLLNSLGVPDSDPDSRSMKKAG